MERRGGRKDGGRKDGRKVGRKEGRERRKNGRKEEWKVGSAEETKKKNVALLPFASYHPAPLPSSLPPSLSYKGFGY